MSKEHPLRQKIARALEHLETSARAFTVAGNAILSMSDAIQKDGIWGAMQPAQWNSSATASLPQHVQPVPRRKERSRNVEEKRALLHMHLQTAMQLGDVGAVQRLSRQLDELEAQSSSTSRHMPSSWPQAASIPVSCERLTATSHAMSWNYAISDHPIPVVPEMHAPSVRMGCPQVAYCQRVSQGYSAVVVGCSAVSDEQQPDTLTAVGISHAMCHAGGLCSRSTFDAGCLPRIEDIRTHTDACRDVCNTCQRGGHTCLVPASRTENRMKFSHRNSDSKWQDDGNHEENTPAHFNVAHEAWGDPVGAVPVGIASQEAEHEAGTVSVGIVPQEAAPEAVGDPLSVAPVGTAPQEAAPEVGGEHVCAVPVGIAPQEVVPEEGGEPVGAVPVGTALREGAPGSGGEPAGTVPVGISPKVGAMPVGISPQEAAPEVGGDPVSVAPVGIAPQVGAVPVGIAPQEVVPEEGGEPVGVVPVGTALQEGALDVGGENVGAVPVGISPKVGAVPVGISPQEAAPEAGGDPVGVAPVGTAPEVRCEHEDDDCDALTSDVYEVETVLEMRTTDDARREFLIKWKGWSSKWNSWEPEVHILDKRVLRKFNKKKREDSAMDDLDTFNMRSKRRCAKQAAVKARQMGRQEIKEDDADND